MAKPRCSSKPPMAAWTVTTALLALLVHGAAHTLPKAGYSGKAKQRQLILHLGSIHGVSAATSILGSAGSSSSDLQSWRADWAYSSNGGNNSSSSSRGGVDSGSHNASRRQLQGLQLLQMGIPLPGVNPVNLPGTDKSNCTASMQGE